MGGDTMDRMGRPMESRRQGEGVRRRSGVPHGWRAFVLAAVIVAAGVSLMAGCGGAKVLESVEVREYEGKDLSSIADFRENSIKGPQKVDAASYTLKITGRVETPVTFSYDDVISKHQLYQKVVTLNCVEGWSVDILWEGVLVKDLLRQAGPTGDARIAIFKCVDGYTTSVDLAYLTGKDILLAYKMNGVVLPPERGFPFQLVAEDKWGYKWAKWIEEIELSSDVAYKGFWEQFGYSRDGSLSRPSMGD